MKDKSKNDNEIFNLGTGKGSSVLEIIKAFEKINGLKLNYKIVDKRPGDVMEVYADASCANKELKWKAERSLENMVKSEWEWEKKLNGGKG